MTFDLFKILDKSHLKNSIPNVPSNTFGEQIWCIIGARESYYKAMINNAWSGFSCSLENKYSKDEILEKLKSTEYNFNDFLIKHNKDTNIQEPAIDLLEHEIQHHGQLIRFMYTNKIPFPKSWNNRYTV